MVPGILRQPACPRRRRACPAIEGRAHRAYLVSPPGRLLRPGASWSARSARTRWWRRRHRQGQPGLGAAANPNWRSTQKKPGGPRPRLVRGSDRGLFSWRDDDERSRTIAHEYDKPVTIADEYGQAHHDRTQGAPPPALLLRRARLRRARLRRAASQRKRGLRRTPTAFRLRHGVHGGHDRARIPRRPGKRRPRRPPRPPAPTSKAAAPRPHRRKPGLQAAITVRARSPPAALPARPPDRDPPPGSRRGPAQSPSAAFNASAVRRSRVHAAGGWWCSAAHATVSESLPATRRRPAPRRSWVT